MKSGDRVMVFDSPGFPVDHYLYANVITPSEGGAVVFIDHPGNLSHAQQKFVPLKKIMTVIDLKQKALDLRAALAAERDADKRKTLLDHVKGFEFMAEQLAD